MKESNDMLIDYLCPVVELPLVFMPKSAKWVVIWLELESSE